MSTLSVPLNDEKRKQMKQFIAMGLYSNEADFARQAIQQKLEEEAVNLVLKAQKEPDLEGDLDKLAASII